MNQSATEKIILQSVSRAPKEISLTLGEISQEHANEQTRSDW